MPLYERHFYLDRDIEFLVSCEIIEYDIKSAGFSLLKTFKLIKPKTIEYLSNLEKVDRNIKIGLILRDDKELAKKLNDCFVLARKKFFEINDIKDEEVLSIKKDAIFVMRRCRNTILNKDVKFVEKNVYTSYYYINNYEFYYNSTDMHVKGISDDKLELHQEYMLDSLRHFFKINEIQGDIKTKQRFIKDFIKYYKSKDLNIGYYRELNSLSMYRLNDSNVSLQDTFGIMNTNDKTAINIGYNYFNYIIPLLNMVI